MGSPLEPVALICVRVFSFTSASSFSLSFHHLLASNSRSVSTYVLFVSRLWNFVQLWSFVDLLVLGSTQTPGPRISLLYNEFMFRLMNIFIYTYILYL